MGLYGLHRAAGGLAPLGPRYGTGILWAYMFKSIYIPPVNCFDILLFVCTEVCLQCLDETDADTLFELWNAYTRQYQGLLQVQVFFLTRYITLN